MAERTPGERLMPCLLDRLTDDEPQKTQESRDQRVMSLRRYRQAVFRDLEYLLNTTAKTDAEALAEFGGLSGTVLNYGVPDLTGVEVSGLRCEELSRSVLNALLAFEPRLIASTLSVRVVTDHDLMDHNAVAFEIEGQLWAEPTPEHLWIKTEVDLETGAWGVKDAARG